MGGKSRSHKRSPSADRSSRKRKKKEKRRLHEPPPDPHALLSAATAGDRPRCRSQLRAGADPTWANTDMATALHTAARGGYSRIVRLLLRAGASAAATDLRGDTPAHLAARAGHLECLADILRSSTAPGPREKNDKGESVEALAASAMAARDRQAQLATELLRADPEHEDKEAVWRERLRREASPGDGGEDGAFWGEEWRPDEYETPEEYAQRIWAEMEDARRRREADELAAARRRTQEGAATEEAVRRARDQEKAAESERQRRKGDEEAAWRAAVARDDPAVRLASYEARWEFFCSRNGGKAVRFSDVPWILPTTASAPASTALRLLLHGAGDADAQRRVLRRELVRWHPDKFVGRFGAVLAVEDKERVLAAVTATGAALTELLQAVNADR